MIADTLAMPWGTMACRQSDGDGIPVVFLHGSGRDSTDWDATISALPDTLRPYTTDFRGHGLSSVPKSLFTLDNLADDVITFLLHINCSQPWLVGHSLGGMVAMAVAQRAYPLAGLVLVEGWTNMAASYAVFPPEKVRGTLSADAMAAVRRKAAATRARMGETMWEHYWNSVLAFDAADFLATTTLPILEIYGDDHRMPDTERKLSVPANSFITWAWVTQGGHYLPQEQPEELARICGQYIASRQS